jgi:transcriptional regulator with XRE-family HTH domain
MLARWLRDARRQRGWTQLQAAGFLGVSQAYLSLLENARRRVPRALLARLEQLYHLPPTEVPMTEPDSEVGPQQLAGWLAVLGYPSFSYMRSRTSVNPAQVLLAALRRGNLETRLTEALPWVVLTYPDLNWDWLLERAKVHDLQNRLGFVVTLAREVAQRQHDETKVSHLAELERRLERSRLAGEDTLCHDLMTQAERRWVRERRPPAAQHWNLLTDLAPEHLSYAG